MAEYKGWKLTTLPNGSVEASKKVLRTHSYLKKKITFLQKKTFPNITLAHRWIGRYEALAQGRGKRKPKPKPQKTKSIKITHICYRNKKQEFTKTVRCNGQSDSITFKERLYKSNRLSDKIVQVLLDHPDKSQDWWEGLPDTWSCNNCSFVITKDEIKGMYLYKKIANL